jgi:hypothetical protein
MARPPVFRMLPSPLIPVCLAGRLHIATLVVIPSAIAEISMVVYLLVIGVKTVKPAERIPGAAAAGVA